ncbi:MAG: OmpA family protein [Sandaracinaceae bacterium]|nr:OmpA family protein [Sandaracinaceae bacterium]
MRRPELLALVSLALTLAAGCGSSRSTPSERAATSGHEGASEDAALGERDEAGGGEAAQSRDFEETDSETAARARGGRTAPASELRPTATEAVLRLFVVDAQTAPITGIVIKLTAPGGRNYYAPETDDEGHTELLVPIGQRYEVEYLSLGRRNTTAAVDVPSRPQQTLRLTLRYRGPREAPAGPRGFVLEGVNFATARATIEPDSLPRLDRIVEYMTHRPRVRILIAGHTDNVGNARANQRLSEQRARAVREYIVSRGIDGGRIESVGLGDEQPVAPNDTPEGRAQNRRIEAIEL